MRRINRPLAYSSPSDRPISELNTTPLIDVMLVLLIMFIMTIPVSTHKVPLDLPQGPATSEDPVVHRLNLSNSGAISFDGVPVTEAQLPARLSALAADRSSVLHLRAEPNSRYETFDRLLALIKTAGINRLGLVDNERYAGAAG